MAKKKPRKDAKVSKQHAQKSRLKGDLVDDVKVGDFELSEELTKENPYKTSPNKQDKR